MPRRRRFVANQALTVERDNQPPLQFSPGQECTGTPAGWPPAWVIERGLVSEVPETARSATAAGPEEKEEGQ